MVAKALFTSCMETPSGHTPSRGQIDQDSQASTVHLQSLHMSSAEEDTLGDTLGSDVADGEEEGKIKKVDGDVQDGITVCLEEEAERHSHSNCMLVREQDKESISTEIQRRTEDEKQNLKKTSDVLVQATAEEDDDNGGTLEICPSAIPTQQLNNQLTGNLSDSQAKFALDQPKQSSRGVQAGSQQSTADLLDNSQSPNTSGLSGVEKSRLDDTLAFFFLTPPQTRSRIANLKKEKQVKETEERIHKTHLSGCGNSTDKVQEAKPLENCFPEISSVSAVRESSQELSEKETRPTRRRNTVIRVKEEDGSLKEFVENLSETQVSQASCKITNLESEGDCGNCFPVVSQNAKNTLDDNFNVLRVIASKNSNASPELALKHSDIINNLPNIPAQPNQIPTSIQDLQPTDTCKPPATISIDVTNVTPLKQTRNLDTASNVESPDIFSQISPNFINALCNLTDEVSKSNHPRNVSPASYPQEQITMNQYNSPSCTTEPYSCILPSAPMQNSSVESKPQPSVPNLTPDQQTSVGDTEISSNVIEKDTGSQLFRMRPQAPTTRRFFYPSGSSNVNPTGGHKAMQWMSEAVLVKSDDPKQENSEPGLSTDNEKATDETTHRNSSHSYSSTPTLRNSGM